MWLDEAEITIKSVLHNVFILTTVHVQKHCDTAYYRLLRVSEYWNGKNITGSYPCWLILLSLGVILLLPLISCWRDGGGMKPFFPYPHPKESSHVVNSKFLSRNIFSTCFLMVNPLIIPFLSVYSFKILCGFLACKNPLGSLPEMIKSLRAALFYYTFKF